jgi:hypothetical protein
MSVTISGDFRRPRKSAALNPMAASGVLPLHRVVPFAILFDRVTIAFPIRPFLVPLHIVADDHSSAGGAGLRSIPTRHSPHGGVAEFFPKDTSPSVHGACSTPLRVRKAYSLPAYVEVGTGL